MATLVDLVDGLGVPFLGEGRLPKRCCCCCSCCSVVLVASGINSLFALHSGLVVSHVGPRCCCCCCCCESHGAEVLLLLLLL